MAHSMRPPRLVCVHAGSLPRPPHAAQGSTKRRNLLQEDGTEPGAATQCSCSTTGGLPNSSHARPLPTPHSSCRGVRQATRAGRCHHDMRPHVVPLAAGHRHSCLRLRPTDAKSNRIATKHASAADSLLGQHAAVPPSSTNSCESAPVPDPDPPPAQCPALNAGGPIHR